MKSRLIEHIAGMIVVSIILLLALAFVTSTQKTARLKTQASLGVFGDLSFIDFTSAFERALLKDAINSYYPGQYDKNDSLYGAIVRQNSGNSTVNCSTPT